MSVKRPCILVFAGVDPSGGAGITADIETIGAMGGHPLTVITALTAQDNNRVHAVQPMTAEWILRQADAVIDAIPIDAIKIGIVGSSAGAQAIGTIVDRVRSQHPELPVVLDPVLSSGAGDALANADPVDAILPLLSRATLVTPNLPEAARLCAGEDDLPRQATRLLSTGCRNVLIKGGHGPANQEIVNHWFSEEGNRSWRWPRLTGAFHGSGCTLASAVATRLALGESMADALLAGQAYTQRALGAAYAIAPGQQIPERRIVFAS